MSDPDVRRRPRAGPRSPGDSFVVGARAARGLERNVVIVSIAMFLLALGAWAC